MKQRTFFFRYNTKFVKKLNEREMHLWITGEIKINKLIIIENKTNHFKSFYAPSLSHYELNRIKKESIENITLKPFTQKSLIKNFREQGILILYVNQSSIHLYQSEIDFNKAYNPPCAFTAFATCPLPPAQNRLKVSITAGEKNYGHH